MFMGFRHIPSQSRRYWQTHRLTSSQNVRYGRHYHTLYNRPGFSAFFYLVITEPALDQLFSLSKSTRPETREIV